MIEFQLQIQLFLLLCLVNRISLKTRPSCSIPFSPGISNLELYYHDDPLSVYYLWNKTDVSAVDYHKNFCADRCDQGVKKMAPSYTTNIQCLECECQKPACEIYDICCEEISDTQSSSNRSISVTVLSKLNCDSKSNPSFNFLYLRDCPASYNESEAIRRLCLEDVNVTETTLDTYMRVIDNETQVVYYNYFCARCHNVTMVSDVHVVDRIWETFLDWMFWGTFVFECFLIFLVSMFRLLKCFFSSAFRIVFLKSWIY